MRRYLIILFILFMACRVTSPIQPSPTSTALPRGIPSTLSVTPSPLPGSPTPTWTALPSATPPAPSATQSLPSLTFTPTVTPTPLSTLTQTSTPVTRTFQATVLFHPDGGLFVGDRVSFEVLAPETQGANTHPQQVEVEAPQGKRLGSAGFGVYGLGERTEAMMVWAWDTRGLAAGQYPLTFTIQPGGETWTETVTLLPQSALPWPEPQAHWADAHSKCCVLNYVTGTAAERDLPDLLQLADEQSQDVVKRMGIGFTAPITITLLPRMLGNGGFASNEIDVSYLDRNYAGSDFGLVLHHEMVHILDGQLGGDYRPSLLVEGLAVYESGGHFKPEPLMPRAAALLPGETGLGWYIPLAELADNFYLSQHEIGYLEGASLIEYMVKTWGWDAFSSFYRDIHTTQDGKPSSAIDAALQKHFQMTLPDLEGNFKLALSRITVTSDMRDDMRLTVQFFDTVRRYQQVLDPSAFFQTAWLLDTPTMRQRGIVADYVRHPAADENLALETLLATAYTSLSQAQYAAVDQVLAAVNAVLDAIQRSAQQPFDVNEQAANFYTIVQAVSQAGYQAQKVTVEGDTARVRATAESARLVELTLVHGDAGWGITAGNAGGGALETLQGSALKIGDLRWLISSQIPIFAQWFFTDR